MFSYGRDVENCFMKCLQKGKKPCSNRSPSGEISKIYCERTVPCTIDGCQLRPLLKVDAQESHMTLQLLLPKLIQMPSYIYTLLAIKKGQKGNFQMDNCHTCETSDFYFLRIREHQILMGISAMSPQMESGRENEVYLEYTYLYSLTQINCEFRIISYVQFKNT